MMDESRPTIETGCPSGPSGALDHVVPPRANVVLEGGPKRPVIPESIQAAIDFTGRKNEATSFAETDDGFHGGGISMKISSTHVGHLVQAEMKSSSRPWTSGSTSASSTKSPSRKQNLGKPLPRSPKASAWSACNARQGSRSTSDRRESHHFAFKRGSAHSTRFWWRLVRGSCRSQR